MSVSLNVRYGFRKLNNNVGFTIVAVACLALGICASVTVFSVINALLLRPIPGVAGQDRLVSLIAKPIRMEEISDDPLTPPLSHPVFLRYRESNRVFSGLAAYQKAPVNLVAGGEPLRLEGRVVTEGYFTTLGLRPARGRFFTPGSAQPEVVISQALWKRVFEARRTSGAVSLNGHPFIVIGVAPAGFRGTQNGDEVDVWMPMKTAPLVVVGLREEDLGDPDKAWLYGFFGRLAPGVDMARAQREMDVLARRLGEGLPPAQRPPEMQLFRGLRVRPGTLGDLVNPLAMLSSVVGLLMLVVCANLGGLLLVKAAARQEEIGVRLALGVTRGQLVRQLLVESVSLSLIGGSVGFLLSLWTVDALRGLSLGQYLPRMSDLPLDGRVVAFTLAISFGTGLLFGLVPALWSTRRQVAPLLRRGGEGGLDRGRNRLQEMFVVGQVTVSLMLLVSTGLFVRTLRNLQSIDPGFDSSKVLDLELNLGLRGHSESSGALLYDQLLGQVRRLPGVRAAALVSWVPLSNGNDFSRAASVQSHPGAAAGEPWLIEYNVVTPGYFRTLGIPLLRGRDFLDADRKGSPPVAIVDETMAKELWPGRNPVGEHVAFTSGETREVVGIARRVSLQDLQEMPRPYFYVPLAQQYAPSMTLQLKTVGDPWPLVNPVRSIVRKLDPSLAVEANRFEDDIAETLAQPRLFSWLFGSFSLTALVVTALGLYGTLAYAVRRRTRELGIRMALGARGSEIVTMVLRRGLTLTLTGLALGLIAASWATSVFSEYLFGVTPTDPGVFLSVALLLALVGLAASSLPAYSATRVDPMTVIRHE
jgi:putative ABC transport system permease protein